VTSGGRRKWTVGRKRQVHGTEAENADKISVFMCKRNKTFCVTARDQLHRTSISVVAARTSQGGRLPQLVDHVSRNAGRVQ
jgi:hypothetical protein